MSVYKDENTGAWFCIFRYKDFSGKTIQKKKKGFRTKREAKDYEVEFQRKVSGKSDMLFESLVELYLADCKVHHRPNVYRIEEIHIGHIILPYFGKLHVKDITAATVRSWQNDILIPNYKYASIKTYNGHLTGIFNYGMRYCGLAENPVMKAGPLRYPEMNDKTPIRFWTREQFEYFLSFVKKPSLRLAFETLFWTGMRNGELMGLRICDIDLEHKEIHIVQNRVRIAAAGCPEVIQAPKTRSSRRMVGITDKLAEEFKAYLDSLYKPEPTDLIFQTKASSLTILFNRYQKLRNITPHIRLHDLRHSHASMLINLGVSPKAVADRLGHANESMVMKIYGHLYPEKRNEIVDKLNTFA